MTQTAPPIAYFTRRLAECPSDLSKAPADEAQLEELVRAVLYDVMSDLDPQTTLKEVNTCLFVSRHDKHAREENSRRLYLILAWLLHDPFFRKAGVPAVEVRRMIQYRIEPLSRVVSAEQLLRDPDRREELCRIALHHLNLLPEGESLEFTEDRLGSLDSVERQRLIAESRAKAARAAALRQEMEQKAAREAAAHYGREY